MRRLPFADDLCSHRLTKFLFAVEVVKMIYTLSLDFTGFRFDVKMLAAFDAAFVAIVRGIRMRSFQNTRILQYRRIFAYLRIFDVL